MIFIMQMGGTIVTRLAGEHAAVRAPVSKVGWGGCFRPEDA